mmetsp:Transcript_29927/g.45768  ORF Transcript_29927/g.45768 Transcript_29927/m.45768 type:complete len:90 (+) Transcript_29927:113-382(+)
MPLDASNVHKASNSLLASQHAQDSIAKDVRAPLIEFSFELQKDNEANSADPVVQEKVDDVARINFKKVELQQFFEELEKVQLRMDELNN